MDDLEAVKDISSTHTILLHKRYFAIISLGCAFSVIPSMYNNSSIYWDYFDFSMPLVLGDIVLYYNSFIPIFRLSIILLGLLFGLFEFFFSIKHQLSKKLACICVFVNLIILGLAGILYILAITALHPT